MKNTNSVKVLVAVLVALGGSVACAQQCSTYSVLSNINCGGGRSTCLQNKTDQSGLVRCTCEAVCLPPSSVTYSVHATRGVAWGPCGEDLTGTADGGTKVVAPATVVSAVFAHVKLQGAYIGLARESTQVSDCWEGLVLDEPLIGGVC